MRSALIAGVVASLVTIGLGAAAAAQDGTPVPFPVAPDPAECRVEPRSIESVVAVVATPVAAEVTGAASPTPFVPPAGEPVDAESAAAISCAPSPSSPTTTSVGSWPGRR